MSSLPSHWQCLPLEEVTSSIANGFTHQNNPASGGIPISRIQTISKGEIDFELVGYAGLRLEDVKKYILNRGDILFSHINSKEHVGKVAIYRDGMPTLIHGMNLLRIVANNKVLPAYLFLAFRTDAVRSQIWANTRHAVNQASINIRNLSTVEIPVPPLDEQKRIVDALDDYLSRLDKALAEVEATMLKFETLERSSLESNFKGALETENADSLPLSAVTEKVKSVDPKTLGVEEFKYVDIGSISADLEAPRIETTTLAAAAPSRARQHLKSGDVVFSTVRPYQKKIALISGELDGQIASTGFCVLRPKSDALDSRYLFHYLKSDMLLDQVLPLQRGASYPAVGDSDVKQAVISLPDLYTQRGIAATLDSVVGTIRSQKSQMQSIIEVAQTLRRSLLQKAFTGELLEEK